MKIITDSSCDLTPELAARLHVDHIIPMRITADGSEYIDRVTLSLDDFYYHILPGCKQLPKTSQVSVSDFMEIYAAYPDEDLLVLPLSSGLSGEYNSACIAAQESGRDNIFVVDNKSTTLALALMAEIACRLRDEGRCAANIQQELEALAGQVGSDVAFCVAGGTQLARSRGEQLEDLPPLPPCWIVVCKPGFSISTPELFRKLDEVSLRRHPDTAGMLAALREEAVKPVTAAASSPARRFLTIRQSQCLPMS